MAERLQKQKSDFTLLKKKHQVATNGDIYESDYMTINPVGDLFDDEVVLFSDSNFKFSVSTKKDEKLKRPTNDWLLTQNNESGTTDWTLETIVPSKTEESKVVLKNDYNSLQDFAYYGSALMLLNASVTDIIRYFPAGLYFKGFPDTVLNIEGAEEAIEYITVGSYNNSFNESFFIDEITTGTTNPTWPYNFEFYGLESGYTVNNPFEIDLLSKWFVEGSDLNELRVLNSSFNDYETDTGLGIRISSLQYPHTCSKEQYRNGIFLGEATITVDSGYSFTIYVLYMDDRMWYITKEPIDLEYIRPKADIIEREFEHFDEFERILLDRTTNPIYTAYFDTPYETETGYLYAKKVPYTWPSVGDYNLQVSNVLFNKYIDELIALAEYYDENYSDNIWRSFTHEAIKNLDWTFMREIDGELNDYSDIDSSRIKAIERVWGRNSDDIKRYIDTIKYVNKVSYDQKNNIPDYFLTDTVEMTGFVPRTLDITMNNFERTDNLNYTRLNTGFTASDVNSEFFRRLKLNAKYLTSVKGRREGVEAMLALLGIEENLYTINEYIAVATGDTNGRYPSFETIAEINSSRVSYVGPDSSVLTDENLNGLPVTRVSVSEDNTSDYVIPWYNIREKYDNGIYFQMFGGWSKRKEKKIGDRIIYSSDDTFTIYDETVPRLRVTETLETLDNLPISTLNEGDVCYVINTTVYSGVDDFEEKPHYYEYIQVEDSFDWVAMDEEDPDVSDKILYLNSIISETEGNNPHAGYGKYDDGKEYLNRLNNIFSYLCDDLAYMGSEFWSNSGKTQTFGITDIGEDNKKSWFFVDSYITNDTTFITNDESGEAQLVNTDFGYNVEKFVPCTGSSIHGLMVPEHKESELKPHNPEGGRTNEEPASYSVVNVKNMEIAFTIPPEIGESGKTQYKEFVNNVVMHYVKQMIPSTTILTYHFNEEYEKIDNSATVEITEVGGSGQKVITDNEVWYDPNTGEEIIEENYVVVDDTIDDSGTPSTSDEPVEPLTPDSSRNPLYLKVLFQKLYTNGSRDGMMPISADKAGITSTFLDVKLSKYPNKTTYPSGVKITLKAPSNTFVYFNQSGQLSYTMTDNGTVRLIISNNTGTTLRSVTLTASTYDESEVYANVITSITIYQSGVQQSEEEGGGTTPPPKEWSVALDPHITTLKFNHLVFNNSPEKPMYSAGYLVTTGGTKVVKEGDNAGHGTDWLTGYISGKNDLRGTLKLNTINSFDSNVENDDRNIKLYLAGPSGENKTLVFNVIQYSRAHGVRMTPRSLSINKLDGLTDEFPSVSTGTINMDWKRHSFAFNFKFECENIYWVEMRENRKQYSHFPGLVFDTPTEGVEMAVKNATAQANHKYGLGTYISTADVNDSGGWVNVIIPTNPTTSERTIWIVPCTAKQTDELYPDSNVRKFIYDKEDNSDNYRWYSDYSYNNEIQGIKIVQAGRPNGDEPIEQQDSIHEDQTPIQEQP